MERPKRLDLYPMAEGPEVLRRRRTAPARFTPKMHGRSPVRDSVQLPQCLGAVSMIRGSRLKAESCGKCSDRDASIKTELVGIALREARRQKRPYAFLAVRWETPSLEGNAARAALGKTSGLQHLVGGIQTGVASSMPYFAGPCPPAVSRKYRSSDRPRAASPRSFLFTNRRSIVGVMPMVERGRGEISQLEPSQPPIYIGVDERSPMAVAIKDKYDLLAPDRTVVPKRVEPNPSAYIGDQSARRRVKDHGPPEMRPGVDQPVHLLGAMVGLHGKTPKERETSCDHRCPPVKPQTSPMISAIRPGAAQSGRAAVQL